MAPDSLQPLAPSGLWVQGWVSSVSAARKGRSPARQGVVHERGGKELAVAVGRGLGERLPDALGEPAVDLALDDHRVDDGADIVNRVIGDDFGRAGFRVHL